MKNELDINNIRPYSITRRAFIKFSLAWAALFSLRDATLPDPVKAADESVPEEPANLDEPTPWQEGDPEPKEAKVPATEPEQTSNEAPPSQPMDDDRPEQPDETYVWVNGYWWWNNNVYVWVPGYWAMPPEPDYVYIAGYWNYSGSSWVYVRGGWGISHTTKVVVYADPRPALTALVITAPIRIARRHHRWGHHHSRYYHHRPHTRPVARPATRPATKPAARSATSPAVKPATKPAARPAARPAGPRRR